ncbi:SAM-dependent methyltransferase [Rhizobium leguminosarum]|uniref:N-6 DNA methylase n=1 Tax=Rhizobium TaxID=379 RepID=UPI0014429AAC|nr:N-6 DNA methylase [Rhizobium leguminosarum]MCA2431024.1 SAM-dependent methyltransferase [Rhizobium leguminosarum]NKK09154.1 N-6 DNA methylase [Rhizobium leguminosarum bv. viciae]
MNFVPSLAVSGKAAGQFFTPESVARSLVQWVVRSPSDVLIDPSCGDGALLVHHPQSRGIEQDPYSAWVARERVPSAAIDCTDFFTWAADTRERFDCAAGNPPFIRYQSFKGLSKNAAAAICRAVGVKLSGLTSTWPAFLIATASLLKPSGRMAFVVPAEIGHAPYARELLGYLLRAFSTVHVIAIREKLFPQLSQDCWLLYCDGRGGTASDVRFSRVDSFEPSPRPPIPDEVAHWSALTQDWGGRLRPLLIPSEARGFYLDISSGGTATRFGDFAKIGIGYVSGDNEFFHLSPSQARHHQIPTEYLVPTVRRGRSLQSNVVDQHMLERWQAADEPCLLLSLPPTGELPETVSRYLETDQGHEASKRYKCRVRRAWYSVPGVSRPDYFLQYMSGDEVRLARNDAGAVCTNSLHGVHLGDFQKASKALSTWESDYTKLSCELEGHPLGGGMLKLEPREAGRISFIGEGLVLPHSIFAEALSVMRRWRHQT